MTALVVVATAVSGIFGIGVAVWSILDTRKRFFNDYMERKRK